MSKIIKFAADFGDFRVGEILEVNDQTACHAIAQGYATPTSDAPDSPKVVAAALESPVAEVESPAVAQAAPETVAADSAPETA